MIIVTGGAGFIGSALIWGFNREGRKDILVVDQHLEGSSKENNLSKLSYQNYCESSDFSGKVKENSLKDIDAVFHLGACSSTTETDKEFLRRNNFEYSRILAEWAVKNNVYFCYASSAATYGAGEKGYSDADSDTLRLKPLNPYGASKLHFDQWVLENDLQKKITGFRYFNVYGPNEYHKGEMRSLVNKGFEQVMKTRKLRLFKSYRDEYADGEQKRDFIYVKDVVSTLIWFWRHPEIKGIYNLGTGRSQTWNDMASALFSACGVKQNIDYIEIPDSIKNQYQYFTQADLKKLKSTGCPTNFMRLKEGVADYVGNYLATDDPYLG